MKAKYFHVLFSQHVSKYLCSHFSPGERMHMTEFLPAPAVSQKYIFKVILAIDFAKLKKRNNCMAEEFGSFAINSKPAMLNPMKSLFQR